jgi:hypothetical protein
LAEHDPPGRLVLERRLRQGEDEHASRVTDDGRVWTRSTVAARIEQGEWQFGPGDNSWRELATLPPVAFAALQDAIRSSGLLDSPPEHGPDSTVIGGSEERWTVELDGRRASTLLRGLPDVHVPAVSAVAEALQAALAAADRE